VCLPRDNIGQGEGVSRKSVFARTSLMENPLAN